MPRRAVGIGAGGGPAPSLGLQLRAGVGVGDAEFLVVVGGVAAEGEAAGVFALDLDEELFVLRAQPAEDVWMHHDGVGQEDLRSW